MATKNIDQRLTKVRGRVGTFIQVKKYFPPSHLVDTLIETDIPLLLELVTGLRTEIKCDRERLEETQERVRELEHHFSDEANSEHMPTQ